MVRFILNELIETEKSYNQLLVLIQDVRRMCIARQLVHSKAKCLLFHRDTCGPCWLRLKLKIHL